MSPLPPSTIKIKRKATDDPVEFLRIHQSGSSGKRQRHGQESYVFSRQSTGQSTASQPAFLGARNFALLPQSACSTAARSTDAAEKPQISELYNRAQSSNAPSDSPPVNSLSQLPLLQPQTRRFHIARPATFLSTSSRKRKVEPTVFIERRVRPKSVEGSPGRAPSADAATIGQQANKVELEEPVKRSDSQDFTPPQNEPPYAQKKPGLKARTFTAFVPLPHVTNPAPLRNNIIPSETIIPRDVTSERLAAEMQAYTLHEIGKTFAKSEASCPKPIPARFPKSLSKFKPKRPAQRYAERHPQEKVDTGIEIDEEYDQEDMDDDSEYIIETYVRIPAEELKTEESGKSFGLLVIDSQPDIDEFYQEAEDSDEEEDYGDEDENGKLFLPLHLHIDCLSINLIYSESMQSYAFQAENYYTADYPDEEVDSDDECNRNRNASDLEEYDEDDAMYIDDENEATRYPWMKTYVRR
ncbi:hypothetical protein BUE80_DR010456 [Diplocarpon rosae]|nr:hypothetical protein BUE80_DR010456 [Diplocarpon rosae]